MGQRGPSGVIAIKMRPVEGALLEGSSLTQTAPPAWWHRRRVWLVCWTGFCPSLSWTRRGSCHKAVVYSSDQCFGVASSRWRSGDVMRLLVVVDSLWRHNFSCVPFSPVSWAVASDVDVLRLSSRPPGFPLTNWVRSACPPIGLSCGDRLGLLLGFGHGLLLMRLRAEATALSGTSRIRSLLSVRGLSSLLWWTS